MSTAAWQERLAALLPLFGHRNWIVIADAAYPAQSRAGIDTWVVEGSHLDAVRAVLEAISRAAHVRPIVYLDAELPYVAESDAPGVTAFREELAGLLGNSSAPSQSQALLHDEIIKRLDAAGASFNVLVLKTDLTIPYTSVFVELDCGYWSAGAEQRSRLAMAQSGDSDTCTQQ